jgi:hypothetical protein
MLSLLERSSAQVKERANLRLRMQEEDRSHLRSSAHGLRSIALVREDQVSHNPILESFTFRVFVQQGRNPMIFRVSRVSLESINRIVNTEKHT